MEPLTTSNATFVRGVSIQSRVLLDDGSTFQLGGVVCCLVSDSGTAPVWQPLERPVLLHVHHDAGTCTVYSNGVRLPMAPGPARVLRVLASSPGKPVHRWDLLEVLGKNANLDKCVSQLRKSLREAVARGELDAVELEELLGVEGPAAVARALIVTRRGYGYLLALPEIRVRLVEV